MKFRNLTIKSLLLAATTLAGSAAFGQRLIVTSPVSLTGEIDTSAFFTTAGGWAPAANFSISAAGVLANDGSAAPTLGCGATWTNAAAVSGKVAIIDRGTCSFSQKVTNAQAAGAVAAIICQNTYSEVPFAGGGGAASNTIPVFMITRTKCNQIKTQLAANVPVNFNLATDINLPNDMRLGPGSEGLAPNWATPLELVRNDFSIGALNRNEGANAQNAVKLVGTVSNAGTAYYNSSVTMAASLASNKDTLMILPTILDPTGKAGVNTITYTASSAATDDLPSDNIRSTTFKLTDVAYSSCRLDASNKPSGMSYTTSTTAANTTKMEWGFVFKTNDKGDLFVADSIRFSLVATDAANSTSASVAGLVATANVYEWDETAFASITSVLAATGQYTFAAGEDGKVVSVSIKDNITLLNPLRLKPNTSYLVTCKVENAAVRVWLGIDRNISYTTMRSIYGNANDARSVTGFLDLGTGTTFSGFTGANPFGVSCDVKKIILPAVAITVNSSNVLTAAPTAGNMPPFTYRWNTTPVRTTATITGIAGSSYIVTMTDALGNATTASYSGTILPNATVTANATGNVLTANLTTGNRTPFTYVWSNSATTSSITVTSSGTYTVTVTDGVGNTTTASSVVTTILPTVAITANTIGNVLTANPTTGNRTPFTYVWNTSATTSSITVTSGGTYRVTMTDALGNTTTNSSVVTLVRPAVSISPNATGKVLTATPTAGNRSPFTYLWSTSATTSSITVTSAGTYSVTMTDTWGNAATASYVLTIVLPTVSITATPTGNVLTATPTAGNRTPFTFLWSTSATTSSITATSSGTYIVTMTDTWGNAATASYGFTAIAPTVTIAANASTSVLTANATGGNTPPFTYLWSNAATTSSITVTSGGTYIVTVTDRAGNAVTASYQSTVSTENTAANFGLKVFPVPANDFTTVSFDFGKSVEVADMIVTDINGRTVSTTRFNNIQNLNKVLNVSNMAAGQYFVTVRTTEGQQTAKFNVVR